ncbi:hypothetical protein HF521_016841 [Silurus meridionalis]|uniref:Methyltransferase type 11 domain-containing protein n=1 Tax=Silurus meridionalis TaxID=175797 RepID=A0A8T0BRN5_SILME|nr:hypothetical protein HF521_016841 [Silurus meridionalis]
MAHRLFEEKHHASIYQKYRIIPPDTVLQLILDYLNKKKGPPHELAVDLGCGTGQNTRLLAPHFQKVVGIDVSECQVEEARAVPGFANVTYRSGPAEELPFPNGSVDLLTAASAAHWFDAEHFLKEAARVLKPHGCIALLGYTDEFSLYYGSCGDKLTNICSESSVAVANSRLQALFEAIPFPDKERVTNISLKMEMTVAGVVGFVESFSYCQTYFRKDPQAATALLESMIKRLQDEMGVSSPDTNIEFKTDFYCVLACKPQ